MQKTWPCHVEQYNRFWAQWEWSGMDWLLDGFHSNATLYVPCSLCYSFQEFGTCLLYNWTGSGIPVTASCCTWSELCKPTITPHFHLSKTKNLWISCMDLWSIKYFIQGTIRAERLQDQEKNDDEFLKENMTFEETYIFMVWNTQTRVDWSSSKTLPVTSRLTNLCQPTISFSSMFQKEALSQFDDSSSWVHKLA